MITSVAFPANYAFLLCIDHYLDFNYIQYILYSMVVKKQHESVFLCLILERRGTVPIAYNTSPVCMFSCFHILLWS